MNEITQLCNYADIILIECPFQRGDRKKIVVFATDYSVLVNGGYSKLTDVPGYNWQIVNDCVDQMR